MSGYRDSVARLWLGIAAAVAPVAGGVTALALHSFTPLIVGLVSAVLFAVSLLLVEETL